MRNCRNEFSTLIALRRGPWRKTHAGSLTPSFSAPAFQLAPRLLHVRLKVLDRPLDLAQIESHVSFHRASSLSEDRPTAFPARAKPAPSTRRAHATRSVGIEGAARAAAPRK